MSALARLFDAGPPSLAGRIFTIVITGFMAAVCGLAALSQVGALVYGGVALEAIEGTATSCYGEGTRGQGCQVSYRHDGEDYSIPVGSTFLYVGDRVPLRFDPANPTDAQPADGETVFFTVVLVMASVCLAAFVTYQMDELRTARRPRKRESGKEEQDPERADP